jgi:hypothetical protein
MLYPRLIGCPDCASIPNLVEDIDCKIKQLAVVEYNNIVFSLNNPAPKELLKDLLNYKRILTYKFCNPTYADVCDITFDQIASRVKVLINK